MGDTRRRTWYKGRSRFYKTKRFRVGIRLLIEHPLSVPILSPPIPACHIWRLPDKHDVSDSRRDPHQFIHRHARLFRQRFQNGWTGLLMLAFELAVVGLADAEVRRRFVLGKPHLLTPRAEAAVGFDPRRAFPFRIHNRGFIFQTVCMSQARKWLILKIIRRKMSLERIVLWNQTLTATLLGH